MKKPYQQIINQYKTIELQTRIDAASPHELIHLLLQGARTHIATAQGNIERKEIQEKGEHISKALSIIEGLKTSLNHEQGGEIAQNLLQLYGHIEFLLLKANLNNDKELLAQSNLLLAQLHEAWQKVGPNHSDSDSSHSS
ncbi:flagellar export chaperone FliS [Fluoribacter dumoffii]|uniref:Flagellar secretion chaperone FliS n=1 Tax=Fluoribacter dumoffii TaxID=463 RepID=A0A377G8N7_9GAMM|nr:flagellar export chaperone FliS [Fluoribacter dumoffii]KTC90044.1 flagellar protein FliS [Fluoribacter dumoffii NY 23]MCW8385343.1 flagellar export chaperone FliS [Fluoribacter dumoffii]MCW8418396.1 flagellar export chaperone FliS [Fluoribacter dumoffii]MCW8453762.1 flagellar export chaperone FliS [Fluoribacter dumoffii]MCW8462167.1 flagellar export chaperone FliS [Fluoribacter dumoffii]